MIEFFTWYESQGSLFMVFPIKSKSTHPHSEKYRAFSVDGHGWTTDNIRLDLDDKNKPFMGGVAVAHKCNYSPSPYVKHDVIECLLSVIL
jgi:hypothetical protein